MSIIKLTSAALMLSLITSCTTLKYDQAYPASDTEAAKKPVPVTNEMQEILQSVGLKPTAFEREISEDLLLALPPDFQLSYEANHLRCVFDDSGGFKFLGNANSKKKFISNSHSKLFKLITKKLEEDGYVSFYPKGYSNVACFIPETAPLEFMDDYWFVDWSSFVFDWQDNEIAVTEAEKAIQENTIRTGNLLLQTDNVRKVSNSLQESITASEAQEAQLEQANQTLQNQIDNFGKPGQPASLFDQKPLRIFNPKIPWAAEKDPFMPVIIAHFPSIADRPWVDQKEEALKSGHIPIKRMHPDLIKAIDLFYEYLNHPELQSPEDKKLISDTGFSLKGKINEAVRTPWIQEIRISQKERGVGTVQNLVAKMLNTDHLLGLVADMGLSGTSFNINADKSPETMVKWKKVEKLLNNHGLYFIAGIDDPVHIGLKTRLENLRDKHTPGGQGNDFVAHMLRDYRQAALQAIKTQKVIMKTLISVSEEQVNQFARLEQALNDEVKKRDALVEKLHAHKNKLEKLMQDNRRLQSDLDRKRQQAKQRAARSERSGGGGGPRRGESTPSAKEPTNSGTPSDGGATSGGTTTGSSEGTNSGVTTGGGSETITFGGDRLCFGCF